MEEPEKGLSSSGTSEPTVAHGEKVGGETLEGSVECGGQFQVEGSFSEELVGEGGACNGKDVMVEVMGSDVYIDGVCTHGSGAELNDEVGCGDSVEGGEDLGKDVKSAGVGSGTEAVQSEGATSENAAFELEREVRDQAVAGSDECGVASLQEEALLDDRAQKEVGTGVSESHSVVNTTPGNTEVPDMADVGGVDCMKAPDAGPPDDKVTNTRCDNALGCSLTGSSVGGENVQSRLGEKDNQKDSDVIDNGAPGDGSDVNLETLDEQKNIGNLQSDKMLDKEASTCDKVEVEEKLSSDGEQPIGNDKVDYNSNNVPEEVVGGTEVARDKALLNSDENQSFGLEKCKEKERITDISQVSSDTGQIADKDMGGDSAMDVSDAEQRDLHKGMEIDVEIQPETERNKIMNHTAEIKGASVSFESEKNLDANAIVEKDAHITDQGPLPPLGDGKENFNDESNIRQNAEEQAGISEQVGSNGGQEIEEEFNEADQRKPTDGKAIKRAFTKPGSSEIFHQARYSLATEKEGEFSVSDMVWGKVRSHPWWPGQIFDPSDASERAMKHYKKDCYLVAYFGDRTFAWNEASQLKHFRTHFSSIEKQSTSESFQNAVDCGLDEITRRVEYGLACSCIPKDTYNEIKHQTVENTGIRRELSFRHGVDESLNASSFSPDKLIQYLKTLSELPTGGFDRLELGIAKAQLLAFYRFKGYSCLPELQYCGDLDNDMDNLFNDDEKKFSEVIEHETPVIKNDGQAGLGNLKNQSSSRHKRKHNLKDTMHPTKKQRRLSELMGGTPDSPDGDYWSDEKVTDNLVSPGHSKKRRAVDHYADDSHSGMQDLRKTISLAKVSNTTKSSFKIGDCIRRVASQLTGSPSLMKCSGDRSQKTDGDIDGFPENGSDVSLLNFEEAQKSNVIVPTEYSSLDDLLSSLQWVAQEPLGEYSFLNDIVSFFSDFRNSIIVADDSGKEILGTNKVGTKRKRPPIAGSPETFEFEDMSDTYWTDRVIDNGNEEQPVQPSRRNRKKDYQIVLAEPEKPVQVNRRSYSRKQYSDSNHAEAPEKPPGYIDENAPAELVMNFAELDSVPSETNLNKMFRRFGPLKESETEVDRVSSRARVVFKKCVDAEVACSSAKKFNIFGPILVNYQLNYTPSALFKASSVATTQDQDMHLDLSNFEVNMV